MAKPEYNNGLTPEQNDEMAAREAQRIIDKLVPQEDGGDGGDSGPGEHYQVEDTTNCACGKEYSRQQDLTRHLNRVSESADDEGGNDDPPADE